MEQIEFDFESQNPKKTTPLTVKQLNLYVKDLIDRDDFLNNIYVKGEISNFKRHYTGHLYFTLKDGDSLIKCVMFKSYTSNVKFEIEDGMQVLILGQVAVYERDGVYQIYVKQMEQDGVGSLYKAYEELKNKLSKKGMFDEKYKKPIPYLPKCIGVVTSKTGAVIKDILNVTTRRYPNVNIKLYPAAVQGAGAAETIVKGIEYFNIQNNVDVIIIARGGGSIEDLWPFNEEIVANAIFESEIPIISAVGHETDFTIADFVSDLRAPTPSAAGELAVPSMEEAIWKIKNNKNKLSIYLIKKIDNMKERLNKLQNNRLFKEPSFLLSNRYLNLDSKVKDLTNNMNKIVKEKELYFAKISTKLDGLSPLKTLSRGFLIATNKENKIIKSINQIKEKEDININLNDGNVIATIKKIEKRNEV